jgi:hypothetical protein
MPAPALSKTQVLPPRCVSLRRSGICFVSFVIGGPGRDRTDDLFHAMEARSQLRHRPTLEEGTTSFIFDE